MAKVLIYERGELRDMATGEVVPEKKEIQEDLSGLVTRYPHGKLEILGRYLDEKGKPIEMPVKQG